MTERETLAKILGVDTALLERLDREMTERCGKQGVMERLIRKNDETIEATLRVLDSNNHSAAHVRSVLRKILLEHEGHLVTLVGREEGTTEFEKAARLAKRVATVGNGFFLKRERAVAILEKRKPEHLLEYLGVKSVEAALSHHDVIELMSALRFVEPDEWMHETFETAYSRFTPDDFEEREIEVRVLGPAWNEVSKKFVAKKHHNVSHLKEFGVIFLNPVHEHIPGKFLRDFALILHYFHEIAFYAKLFRKYAGEDDFAGRLKMLLRGDVPEIYRAESGAWLIVQRYLAKEHPEDPRLFLPRVNPESMHWARGERDLTSFRVPDGGLDLSLWHDLDWVGGLFDDGAEHVVSFDLEDNVMTLVSFMEGENRYFNYHQRESMWTKMFSEYAGGEERMEELLIANFDKGVVLF